MSNSDGRARRDRSFVRINIFAILNWGCCRGNQSAVSQSGPQLFVGAQCPKCQKAAASAIVPQKFRDGFACSGLTDWRHEQLLKAHTNGDQRGNLVLSVWEEPIHRHDCVQMDHDTQRLRRKWKPADRRRSLLVQWLHANGVCWGEMAFPRSAMESHSGK
jgi:Zn ribbon nucleic-acid-binding protein